MQGLWGTFHLLGRGWFRKIHPVLSRGSTTLRPHLCGMFFYLMHFHRYTTRRIKQLSCGGGWQPLASSPLSPCTCTSSVSFSFDNFTFLKDAFTTLNLLACPAIEPFTLATKVPKGKTISIIPADSSRLEYQARSNVVHVATNRKPYLDEKKKVIMHAFYYYFLRRSTPKKNPQLWTGGSCPAGVLVALLCSQSVLEVAPCLKLRSTWVAPALLLRLMVFIKII